ncbi:MAG: hypothetical protein IK066_08485 [Kiritimatiellae bacterium]|nr:hypothetical protein [Kiritimatiellia bacterium]
MADECGNAGRWRFAAAVAACWLVMGMWVTGQSLWLDEGMAVSKSIQPTWTAFWKGFSGTRNSDLQQPLFMVVSWGWAKVVGRSEWGLRSLNWLWMAVAMGYVASRPWANRRVRLLWCALAALSPFMAMYMDEAKGYILHFAGGTLLFLSIAGGSGRRLEDFDFGAFSVGLLLTCGAALTGVVYAFWACLWLLARPIREKGLGRFLAAHWGWVAVDAVGLAVLAGWYGYTLWIGARGTDLGPPTVATMAFLAYEWFGFSGVGPARLVMRVEGARAMIPYAVPVALYAAVHAYFAFEGFRVWRERASAGAAAAGNRPRVPAYAMPLLLGGLGLMSMVIVGLVDDMAVRARHVMPVFPAALLFAAVWTDRMLSSARRSPRVAAALLLAAMAASSLALRFGERHGKENYRLAVAMAQDALRAGQCVWWAADGQTASVYGADTAGPGRFLPCMSADRILRAMEYPPDVVFVNRPDTWDRKGLLADYIAEHGLRQTDAFHGFRIYKPCGEGPGGGGEATQ